MRVTKLRILISAAVFFVSLFAFGLAFPQSGNATGDHGAVVTDWYWVCHGRAPDSGGYNYWVGQLNSIGDHNVVFSNFVASGGCPRPTPRCNSFTASNYTPFAGDSVTLTWTTSNGKDFGTLPFIQNINSGNSSLSFRPTSSGTYTFLVTNPNGSATCSLSINIRYRFNNNRPNVPSRLTWSNGTYCGDGTLLHDRTAWLSSSSNTASESATVSSGQDYVNANLNLVGRACTAPNYSNASSSDGGRIVNQSVGGDSVYVVGATLNSSPAIAGLSTNIVGSSVSIDRSGQYAARPGDAWTSINSDNFTISGLSSASPGTYTVTVNATVKYTSLLNGSRVCSANQAATGSIAGSNCPDNTTSYTLTITVPAVGVPGPECEIYGPTPTIINPGGTSTFGWGVVRASTVRLDGVIVGHVVTGHAVSPDITTDYVLVATDDQGRQDICEITVVVQDDTTESFVCNSRWYQVTDGILRHINLETGEKVQIGNTGNPRMNAIGYNYLDNFLYGIHRDLNDAFLARINPDGTSERLSGVIGTSASYLVAGDMDNAGNLWYIPNYLVASISKINVTTLAVTNYSLSSMVSASDIVYSNGFLYGINTGTRQLAVINTGSSAPGPLPVSVHDVPELVANGQEYTSGWTTSDGKLYFYRRATGQVIRIDNKDSNSPSAVLMPVPADSVGYATTDGASCPNAPDPNAKINYPFIRAQGSDVVSGAVFAGVSGNACSGKRKDYSGEGSIKTNGFRPHTYSPSGVDGIKNGSSSSQYAAFAYGIIGSGLSGSNSFVANNGYYRTIMTSSFRDILFANRLTGSVTTYGSYFEKGSLPCVDIAQIKDKVSGAIEISNVASINASMASPGSNLLLHSTTTNINLSSFAIPAGKQVVLLVDGVATVSGNITYGSNPSSSNGNLSATSFTLIAEGGINIQSDVSRIDGYYLAHDSTLNTCSGGAPGNPTVNTCPIKLTINGALSGKKIEWRRNYGTLNKNTNTHSPVSGSACAVGSQDSANNVSTPVNNFFDQIVPALNDCSAEFVNFSPSFYFANPFTLQSGGSGVSGTPLNTTELPPIY